MMQQYYRIDLSLRKTVTAMYYADWKTQGVMSVKVW